MSQPSFDIRHDTHCRICRSSRLQTVLSLAPTPAEDQFVTSEQLDQTQPCWPLDLALCEDCGYVFLPYILNPELSYPGYIYVSKVTVGLSNHYQEYADALLERCGTSSAPFVVDLGSNDGTMLEAFQRRGCAVLGVEPGTAVSQRANEAGVPTINAFFTASTVEDILKDYEPPSVITANYMFANIDDLHEFTKNVAALLAPEGLFSVQTGYHPAQFEKLMFDYIYHEHFSYFTVAVLDRLFTACGLELISAEATAAKGGSLRVIAQKRGGPRPRQESVEMFLRHERKLGVDKPSYYTAFREKLATRRTEVRSLLSRLKAEGKRVAGYGASHSTTTLIYHFGLGEFLDYIVDDNQMKHGRYSPGLHLPVFAASKLLEDRPDYVFVLGWQHQESILKKAGEYLATGGCCVVPFPELRTVKAAE